MSKQELRITVIEIAHTTGKFDPTGYSGDSRRKLTAEAWKLVDENKMRYWTQDNGNVIFTLE